MENHQIKTSKKVGFWKLTIGFFFLTHLIIGIYQNKRNEEMKSKELSGRKLPEYLLVLCPDEQFLGYEDIAKPWL